MKLHLLSHGLWTVLAVYADEERCDVLDLAKGLRRDDPGEFARLMRASSGCRLPGRRATCGARAPWRTESSS